MTTTYAKNLVIVESPAKVQTISKYLSEEYVVKASYGHIRDLPKTKIGVDVAQNFEPEYRIAKNKLTLRAINEIETLYNSEKTHLYLATDKDREGEAIGWHLVEILKPSDSTSVKRIVFDEITQEAINEAFRKPIELNMNLVNAQQARRVLDRLVGYELSPLLWKTIRSGLSAGRVQSVALRLVVERERQIELFSPKSEFKVKADFETEKEDFLQAELSRGFKNKSDAHKFFVDCAQAQFFVEKVAKVKVKKSPPPPFITSSLQQEASRRFGYPVKKTMRLAQRLYETGKITYMRTDSVHLSDFALQEAKKVVSRKYGPEYSHSRQYKTKTVGAQEAHEAIRPTDFALLKAGETKQEQRLYELIWHRAIASQMSDALFEKTTLTISISLREERLQAKGEVLLFDGFLRIYTESKENGERDDTPHILAPLHKGDQLNLLKMIASERFTRPAPRYSEAALVRKLEELGIGRPSTYAPTISTILDRGYVNLEDRPGQIRTYNFLKLEKGKITEALKEETVGKEKSKLFPTQIGTLVNDFLVKHFPEIVDYQFTAKIEKEFDEIASGKKFWRTMIADFYSSFHHDIITKKNTITREETLPARELGQDPQTGKPVYVRMGPYGFYVQLGEKGKKEKPKFASLSSDQTMDSITLAEALKLFDLPRVLGHDENGNEIAVHSGRFGPYLKVNTKNISIAPENPYEISLQRALQIITEQKEKQRNRIIKEFPEHAIQILNGRWGPYVTNGRQNITIPKKIDDPAQLTVEECLQLLEKKSKRGQIKKKPKK